MSDLQISLFGHFEARSDGQPLEHLNARRVQELLSYLVLNRSRPHSRETIADLLWEDYPTERAKKCLRQTLWQLKTALDPVVERGTLQIDGEWIGLHLNASVRVDVARFEQVFASVKYVDGQAMTADCAGTVRQVVDDYRGDLLEGWYHEWCLIERNRLHQMYFTLLDKLVDFCTARGDPVAGIVYGERLLLVDPAHERTHQRLMALHHAAGDRTAALRQYQRCEGALKQELGIRPAQFTSSLYEQIRADTLPSPAQQGARGTSSPPEMMANLQQLQQMVSSLQAQLQQWMHLNGSGSPPRP
jgi:DNA-binding SARP family transcriptional activator